MGAPYCNKLILFSLILVSRQLSHVVLGQHHHHYTITDTNQLNVPTTSSTSITTTGGGTTGGGGDTSSSPPGASNHNQLTGNEDFTFTRNGSFLQIDAGREWPFNSKREISFRFKTKSPHGLLIYQTFDHNKLHREDDSQENLEIIPQTTAEQVNSNKLLLGTKILSTIRAASHQQARQEENGEHELPDIRSATRILRQVTRSQQQQTNQQQQQQTKQQQQQRQQTKQQQQATASEPELSIRSLNRISSSQAHSSSSDGQLLAEPLAQLGSSSITATASEKLVNSLFSSSHISTINGNLPARDHSLIRNNPNQPLMLRDKAVLVSASGSSSMLSARGDSLLSTNNRNRLLNSIVSGINSDDSAGGLRINYGSVRSKAESNDGSPVLSSSTINSLSASLYELYIKLENGRLKIVYEFGSRLNQTYCGKSLNDDRWHRVDLKVDPEINQMILTLDQMINVEIALSPILHEDDGTRRNELVFTNSILYLGGLNNNASIVKNVRQRLYMAQFIGCLGQIMLKTDQSTESTLQPAPLDKMVLVKRGCRNLCDTDNYCLHKSTCLNYYTHTKCDCFGTNYEDIYCWQDKLTTISMLGYSTLVYRIYDWRDRHHSTSNRFSMQFRTLARDSILFFAYGDLSAQQAMKNPINFPQSSASSSSITTTLSSSPSPSSSSSASSSSTSASNLVNLGFPMSQVNISNLATIHRPAQTHQMPSNNNYLALSLANGSLVVEISFGDQPILLSNLLHDKINNLTAATNNQNGHLTLSDGRWHNVTLVHSGKQLSLHLDGYSVSQTVLSKNNHLYFDPSIYVGGVPNFLLNETRALLKPINLRYKFVGCMRSVYFNQQNILLDLKRGSQMVEYRDLLGKPLLDTCELLDPNSLPLTLRSGKSYLTFQLSPGPSQIMSTPHSARLMSAQGTRSSASGSSADGRQSQSLETPNSSGGPMTTTTTTAKKLTWIEFEYKTYLTKHFLAGGHLRDLSYHDLGGFWTLQAREQCQLYFTISSGLTFDPEQVLVLGANGKRCEPGQWYKVSISIMSGDKALNITRTSVDTSGQSSPGEYSDHGSYVLGSSVELLHQVQLGGDLAKFGESSSIPFSGCIRRIIINGHSFDSRDFVTTSTSSSAIPTTNTINNPMQNFTLHHHHQQSQYDVISSKIAQGYVTIDSCQLVNPCLTLNPCKNGGVCKVNELGEPDCDCSKTGYTGRRCHFSIYKRSCQDLYLSGQRKSSFYLIDLDRNGPLKPVRVRCNMDSGFQHIETSLAHNLPAEYLIRRSSTMDIFFDITYLAFHHMYTHDGFYLHDDFDDSARAQQDQMLRALIGQSTFCKQHFRYECRSAPLNLGNKTWMEVPYPRRHRLMSLDGGGLNVVGKCACASSEKRCLDAQRGCNCDSGESIWSEDSNDLVGHDQVGVTRIVLLRQNEEEVDRSTITSSTTSTTNNVNHQQSPAKQALGNVESQSRISLSDLKCYGTVEHGNQHEITFKTSDAYIEVPGWRRGDISFNFRTASSPPAIILYQLATSRNHGYFRLTLITDTRLLFEFIVNRRPRRLTLVTSHRLNNGEWQQVFIEYDSANIRLTINDDSVLVDLDPNDHLGTFEGPMFIGGAPSKYLVGDLSRRNGFTGCFKGLNINGRSIDLNDYLSSTMPTVISGCRPSCKKNLCQNGGKCIEYWGSYECECSNPIAHSGSNCEINLNTNSITFITPESHYVEQTDDSLTYPPYLIKSILLNIRTYQETALVLYAHDKFNNFVQLHKNGSSLVLTFNSNATIVAARVPIDDETTNPSLVEVTNQPPVTSTPSQPMSSSQPSLVSQLDQMNQLALLQSNYTQANLTTGVAIKQNITVSQQLMAQMLNNNNINNKQQQALNLNLTQTNHHRADVDKFSIRVSNTSGSGQPIQVKIERHRLRTTFFVNNNFVVIEKPLVLLTDYTQIPWLNPELELVRPIRPKIANPKAVSRIFLANIDEHHFSTRLPGFTGCIQGFSIDNQLFDFNRAHLTGEMKGDYKIGCKMHCDSFPCKNQGTCVENWIEDKIQCKCDTTSYVGRLCDEDIAAMFNGVSSHFIYNINRKLSFDNTHHQLTTPTTVSSQLARLSSDQQRQQQLFDGKSSQKILANNITTSSLSSVLAQALNNDLGTATAAAKPGSRGIQSLPAEDQQQVNFLEVSLAFSSEMNQSTLMKTTPIVQVIVWITTANSTKYFFLGLTSDGGLLIQEDFGNSMSLSRLIKKPEQPFNDGYRHMVKYSRYNNTIQITVDHQTYLPTMSIIAANRMNKFSKDSLIIIGTSNYQQRQEESKSNKFSGAGSGPINEPQSSGNSQASQQQQKQNQQAAEDEFVNYNGCISNLIVRMNDITIEPFNEAFGQNLETININTTSKTSSSLTEVDGRMAIGSSMDRNDLKKSESMESSLRSAELQDDYTLTNLAKSGELLARPRLLSIVDKVSRQDAREDMETMITQDVEQGKCASFKRVENSNEKRSVNEPKFTQLLDPRPAYMDPPRIKLYDRSNIVISGLNVTNKPFKGALFYISLTFLAIVCSSLAIYAYILQLRYNSEKFRCETPFFNNKREETPFGTPIPDFESIRCDGGNESSSAELESDSRESDTNSGDDNNSTSEDNGKN